MGTNEYCMAFPVSIFQLITSNHTELSEMRQINRQTDRQSLNEDIAQLLLIIISVRVLQLMFCYTSYLGELAVHRMQFINPRTYSEVFYWDSSCFGQALASTILHACFLHHKPTLPLIHSHTRTTIPNNNNRPMGTHGVYVRFQRI